MSSLFGALDTAVSGLTAQSAAFGNISDNVANSQTTGFKSIDTSFADYLTTSTRTTNDSGFVSATPDYLNKVQDTISVSDNPLALAISGNGFFQVSQTTNNGAATSLAAQPEYTRNGNFTLNANGYLVNDTGEALSGWTVNPATGAASQGVVAPIKIDQSSFTPVATSSITLSANLPATPASTAPIVSQVNVYDASGNVHTVSLSWTQSASNTWTVAVSAPDATTPALGSAEVQFGGASSNGVPAGTVGTLSNGTGTVTTSAYAAGGPASLSFSANFGGTAQTISLSLGDYGATSGVTQFAGSSYTLGSITQNGIAPGAFSGVTMQSSGNVVVNYDNGQSQTVAQVPVVIFANADALQRQDGQAFTPTSQSGAAAAETAGASGAGTLVTGSLEGSNVDIATEFTKLIVAQQAYSANTKVVSTANSMLQQTINIIQ